VRDIALAPHGTRLDVTTRFVAEPGMPAPARPVAVWTVTQLPAPPVVRARLCGARLLHAAMPDASPWPAPRLAGDHVFFARTFTNATPKAGLDADEFAVDTPAGLFVQQQLHASRGTQAAAEQAQLYSSANAAPCFPPGRPYVELEFTSPLSPAVTADGPCHTIRWELLPPGAPRR
jgi:hypothetical protein